MTGASVIRLGPMAPHSDGLDPPARPSFSIALAPVRPYGFWRDEPCKRAPPARCWQHRPARFTPRSTNYFVPKARPEPNSPRWMSATYPRSTYDFSCAFNTRGMNGHLPLTSLGSGANSVPYAPIFHSRENPPKSRKKAQFARIGIISSLITLKPESIQGPNEVEIATSVASRPRAMRIRPIRGMLCRASNVYQRPAR